MRLPVHRSIAFHLFSIVLVCCAPLVSQQAPVPTPEGYRLVWQDEFDQPQIDLSRWDFEVNAHGGGNHELQYYTARPENAYIQDGNLVIHAIQEHFTGPEGTREYTSARMRTKYRGDWKYGWFEVKAKLPCGQGLWPAIWLLPTDWLYGGWAASGEIDIMELLGQEPDRVYGTIHYGGVPPKNTHTGDSIKLNGGPDFCRSYHVFALEWLPGEVTGSNAAAASGEQAEIRWYLDGKLYEKQNKWFTTAAPYPSPFDQRFHIILNVAVGGDWPGSPDSGTNFPQTMQVDYVRVFQRKTSSQ